MQKIDFFSNASASGSTAFHAVTGGRYIFGADGAFNGTSIQLQAQGPGGAALNVADGLLTAPGLVGVLIADGSQVRAVMSGGTPANIFCNLVSVRT